MRGPNFPWSADKVAILKREWAAGTRSPDIARQIGTTACNVRVKAGRLGLAARAQTHGWSLTKEYWAWSGAKDRCNNPNYHAYRHYGGRGIKFHAPWLKDFAAFLKEVGAAPPDKPYLDRIDVNGNYEPGNLRWVDATTNARNTRDRKITAEQARAIRASHEPTQTLAARYGICISHVSKIKNGWERKPVRHEDVSP